MGNGIYGTPWGYNVKVAANDAARVHGESHPLHGLLAGSSLTMNRAIENLQTWLRLPPYEVWAMGTCNPARVVGLSNKGLLQVGSDADVVLWNQIGDRLLPAGTWIAGRCVYRDDGGQECKLGISHHDSLVSI